MKVGDLVWYNCGGSQQKGLVLAVRDMASFHPPKRTMALIHWFVTSRGPRPASYDSGGMRIFGKTIWSNRSREIDYEWTEGWVPLKTAMGKPICKVISEV